MQEGTQLCSSASLLLPWVLPWILAWVLPWMLAWVVAWMLAWVLAWAIGRSGHRNCSPVHLPLPEVTSRGFSGSIEWWVQ